MPVEIKRAYDKPSPADGKRVLVDRLWPRGISKEQARVDLWLKDLAPSDALCTCYHASANWELFRKRYFRELCTPEASAALETLYNLTGKHKKVTLLYSSRNLERNNASALKELIEGSKKPPSS